MYSTGVEAGKRLQFSLNSFSFHQLTLVQMAEIYIYNVGQVIKLKMWILYIQTSFVECD